MHLTEITILRNLVHNEDYYRKSLPYIQREYFQEESYKLIYGIISEHINKYNVSPTVTSLNISLEESNITDKLYKECVSVVETITSPEEINGQWLLDKTEAWCKDRALYNAIMKSIRIIDDENSSSDKGSLPKILQEALAVSFDTHIGHDFIDDYELRYEFYQRVEERIPFHLEMFNKITKGGLPKKTLNIALAGTGVGKSLFMCDLAASHMMMGKNVLYITMEMSEEKIAERIDANLLNIPISQMSDIPKDTFDRKVERLRKKTTGKLIIKEYPTANANANHFRHLMQELYMKKQFVPDVIYIDYLNICASSRIKHGSNVNSYSYIKSIAEELRGLAVEHNVPIVSATQTTRSGYSNTDVGLEDTSESFGLPATADMMFALISTEELEELNQIMVKQLKNRYNDPNMHKRFVVGIDRSKMRLYDAEESAQDDLVSDSSSNTTSSGGFGKKSKNIGNVEINL